ncbi:MAG TPA: hypothetical protein QGF58_13900 [Myxococcota bacterium]|nr:hypothetical protein [Myxococcota bacterium]
MSLFYVPRSATFTDAAPTISTPFGPLRLVATVAGVQLPVADRAVMAGNDDRYLSWEGSFGEVALKFLAPRPRIDRSLVLTALRVGVWRFALQEAVPVTLTARFLGGLSLSDLGGGCWADDENVLCVGASHGADFLSDGLQIDVLGVRECHIAVAWAPNDEGVRGAHQVNPAAAAALSVDASGFDL